MLHNFLLQVPAAVADSVNAMNNGIVTTVDPGKDAVTITPFELLMKGGIIMYPLILLLLLALYFGIERLIVISKAGKLDRHFMLNIKDYLLSGKIDSERELCRASITPG